eukprot:scaffold23410_cov66-Phaeocystis_antarctica.AAC.3
MQHEPTTGALDDGSKTPPAPPPFGARVDADRSARCSKDAPFLSAPLLVAAASGELPRPRFLGHNSISSEARSYDLNLDELGGNIVEQLNVGGAVRRALRPRLGRKGRREGLLKLLGRARSGVKVSGRDGREVPLTYVVDPARCPRQGPHA